MNPKISVIIPCYNRVDILKKTLCAYDRQIPIEGGFEIIAVDDGSSDGTFELLNGWHSIGYSLKIFRQVNSGPGKARNKGIEAAKGKYILFTGDDIIPTDNFLLNHLRIHKELDTPTVAVLGKTIWDEDFPVSTVMRHITGMGAQQFSYYFLVTNTYVDFRHFYTSNISIPAELLKSLDHLFDPDFTKAAFEDVELGYRLEKNGMKIYYTDSPLAMHNHFYSVQAFCNRQYNAGLMSHVLINKHPELKKLIWCELLFKTSLTFLNPILSKKSSNPFSKELDLQYFEEATIRMAMHYEFIDILPLDALYQALFLYFYYKGQIKSMVDEQNTRNINEILAFLYLCPAVSDFIDLIRKNNVPFPSSEVQFIETILQKIIPLSFAERISLFGYRKFKDTLSS